MNSLVTRGSLFDDFFKDIAPGFYVRPLHGDGVPTPSQIKVDVKMLLRCNPQLRTPVGF